MNLIQAFLFHVFLCITFAVIYSRISDPISFEKSLYHSLNVHFALGFDVNLAKEDKKLRRLTMVHILVAFATMLITRSLFCAL